MKLQSADLTLRWASKKGFFSPPPNELNPCFGKEWLLQDISFKNPTTDAQNPITAAIKVHVDVDMVVRAIVQWC